MNGTVFEAPAKVNLSLKVLRRREDGFHEIDSLMVRLPGLCDRLVLKESHSDRFTCDDPGVPADGGNLVLKALDAYRRVTGSVRRFEIHLEKRIPHGAGLGGGSSDAAATLRALNDFHEGVLDADRLMEIAADLGSDIPFFLGPPAARASGRGERLAAADPPPRLPILLLKPAFGVPTPDAYKAWSTAKELPGVDYRPREFPWGELVNDLERPVFAKHFFLAEVKMWLLGRPEVQGALMSGSGSTMFALLNDPGAGGGLAEAARRELDPTLWSWQGTLGY